MRCLFLPSSDSNRPINTELVFNQLCLRRPPSAPGFFSPDEGTVDFPSKPLCQGCGAHPRAPARVCCKSRVSARSRRGSLLADEAPPTAQEATPAGSWQRGCSRNRSRNEADDGWSLFTLRAACIIHRRIFHFFVFLFTYVVALGLNPRRPSSPPGESTVGVVGERESERLFFRSPSPLPPPLQSALLLRMLIHFSSAASRCRWRRRLVFLGPPPPPSWLRGAELPQALCGIAAAVGWRLLASDKRE